MSFLPTHTQYLQRAGLLAVSRSQNLYCSHRLNTTQVDSLYLEMCSGDIYKIQMCYFIDKKLIMMVEVMFKNWGLDSPGRQCRTEEGWT